MKNILYLVAFWMTLPFASSSQTQLNYPVDVVYNQSEEIYYISNWGDGNGSIVTMDKFGEVTGTLFSDLAYSSGICMVGDVLYIAENKSLKIDEVPLASYLVAVDIHTGEELSRTEINSAWTYLELITTDNSGNIYINDSYRNAIYKYEIATKEVSTFLSPVYFPIGIYYDYLEDRILFTQSYHTESMIKAISPQGGEVTDVFWWPGWLQGITMNSEGEYFVSSWDGEDLYNWGDEMVFKMNHDMDWTYMLLENQYTPFGICMGHDNFLAISHFVNHEVQLFSLDPYSTDNPVSVANKLDVRPNPGNGLFSVRLPEVEMAAGEARLAVLDMNGREIYTLKVTDVDATEVVVDITHLPAGIYVLLVQEGALLYREKLVIQ